MLTEWKQDWGKKSKMALICSTPCDHSLFDSALCFVYPLVFVKKINEKQATLNPRYLLSVNSYVRTEILTLS